MKKYLKNLVKKQKGITLIALVITIIVLLILAGVSIATLTGNNGSIESCYNSGACNGIRSGGVVSQVSSESRVSNCFVCNSNIESRNVIHWPSSNEASGIFTNCYYNKDFFDDISNVSIGTGLTATQMKSSEFLDMIGNNFKADTNNINNSFPVLSFE